MSADQNRLRVVEIVCAALLVLVIVVVVTRTRPRRVVADAAEDGQSSRNGPVRNKARPDDETKSPIASSTARELDLRIGVEILRNPFWYAEQGLTGEAEQFWDKQLDSCLRQTGNNVATSFLLHHVHPIRSL